MSCGSASCSSTLPSVFPFATPVASQRAAGRERVVSRGLRDWLALALHWRERARQRQALLELDDRMLADIGVSREDALREAQKPFWQ